MNLTTSILSLSDVAQMRRVCSLAAQLLISIENIIQSGLSTQHVNIVVEKFAKIYKVVNAPLNYAPHGYNCFPRSVCVSINNVICHGIPNFEEILINGDIVNIDVTLILDGFFGDTSKTIAVKKASKQALNLVAFTEQAMWRGIKTIQPYKRLNYIGETIQKYVESYGYSVVREFIGHGIGKKFHCAPQVFHYKTNIADEVLLPGMCFTVEPMVNIGSWQSKMLHDGWTSITNDISLSAQFEHTILVTESGVDILTIP